MRRDLRIAVVGAGLGGMTAAGLLQRAGFRVKVYEQASAFSRIGAGIHLSANVMMVMQRLGIQQTLVDIGMTPDAFVSRKWDTGATLFELPLGPAQEAHYGGPYINVHRGDLHAVLESALAHGTVAFGHRLMEIEQHDTSVRLGFGNGVTEDADIVIGADGVNSKLREFLLGADKPRFSGYIAHRAIFPAALLNGLPIRACTKWWGPESHILVYYMTQAREEVYVVSSVPAASWDSLESFLPCDRESFVNAFDGFHPELRQVVAAAPDITQWPIFDRKPVDCWSRGALVLLGDACHPMRPYMASGAAMAIEDGAILARCIAEIGTDDPAETFRWYEANRMPRTNKVQRISEANTWPTRPDPYRLALRLRCLRNTSAGPRRSAAATGVTKATAMEAFICITCGTQYAPTPAPPAVCLICDEERQFVPPSGQVWTTLKRLERSHMPTFRDEAGLIGIGIAPAFGINQRALLVPNGDGNVLWDCVSLVSDVVVELIKGIGGLKAIAISHPHYYTTMVEWSRAFGGIPVYLHAADQDSIMRSDPCLELWSGESKEIASGLTLVRTGGHYDGGTIMHWAPGCAGRGALLSGDLIQVVADRKHLGFMRSYPNFIPLGAAAVRTIAERVQAFEYDAIYGAFWNAVIPKDAKRAMQVSVARHIEWLDREIV